MHVEKLFKSLFVTLLVRGHSYLECDRNSGVVNTKTRTKVPEDLVNVFEKSSVKSEFLVVTKNIKHNKVVKV